MIRHAPSETPILIDFESQKLVAMTTTYGLHMVKVTHYDDECPPRWSTACSDGWEIETTNILWWAYASEVQALLEAS